MVCVPILQHCCPVRNCSSGHKTTVRTHFHQIIVCFITDYSDEGESFSTYSAVKVLQLQPSIVFHLVDTEIKAQVQLMTVIALKALNTLVTCSPHYIVLVHLCLVTCEEPGLVAFHLNLCQLQAVNFLFFRAQWR